MATTAIGITLARPVVNQGSVLNATAYFRQRSDATAATPTSARYRVDTAGGAEITAWTTLTPSSSISFTVPASANVIRCSSSTRETRRLTIEADAGLSSQIREDVLYEVVNINAA